VFEIEDANPAFGQVCQTTKPVSDNLGIVEGICFAKKAGFLYVYLREVGSPQRTKNSTLKFIYPPGKNPSINAIDVTPTKTVPNEVTPTPTVPVVENNPETEKKIEDLESKVETLTESLENQNKKVNALQLLLDKIISFLERIPILNLFQSNN